MKKRVVVIALGGLLAVLFIIARLTHGLDYYRIPTESNQPTYHPGSLIFASRFKKPDRNTFVCFKPPKEKSIWVYRCIAKGGDLVEIKDGIVFLNGRKLDEPYTWTEYIISQNDLNKIRGYVAINKYHVEPMNDSLSAISLPATDLKNYHLNLKPVMRGKGVPGPEIFADFANLKYNADNLGPIKVPENSYFLMGDNRHNAFDSRYLGFIKADQIVATVISY